MRYEEFTSDIVVVGGGLAGCCAAIAAARQGATVALVQNRPVLGGNSSSEVRVWACGATAHGNQHHARETGIVGEMLVENQFRNIDGNPYYWDLVVLEAVRAEPNLTLFLNTDVRTVDAVGPDDDRFIRSVTGWMVGSEREIKFRASSFIDCSGDGLVGHLAGARYRTGCEGADEYGESWAVDVANDNTLGSTILFYSKDVGHPVKYVPPSFARDITATSIPERRVIREDLNGCSYWWIEWGGEKDVVHDNEEIRDELQAAIYGIWDYIKNSGTFDADNLTLEWVGSVPGKREYRRFIGDYTMTQHDILEQPSQPDNVGFGGWPIDLHPPGGMYATEKGSRHWHPDGCYEIPLRSLYSQNVRNMWMAGRNMSCSHVAFGSTRVMLTCGVAGEAAGTGAALALQTRTTPRELVASHLTTVRNTMVRADASILGVANTDPDDLARTATVTGSSTLRALAVEDSMGAMPLEADLGMVFPVNPSVDYVELLVDATAETELTVELYNTGKPQCYLPRDLEISARAPVAAGQKQWVRFDLPWAPEIPRNAFLMIRKNPRVALHQASYAEPGTIFFLHRDPPADEEYLEQWREWKYALHRQGICYRVGPRTNAYAAELIVGGYARPFGGPQMWVSEWLAWDENPWVELTWPEPVTFAEIALVLDDEVHEDLINLHAFRTPFEVLPGLIRDYRVEATVDGTWTEIVSVMGNRRRHRVHGLDRPVTTDRLRITMTATNGAPRAHLVAARVYRDRAGRRRAFQERSHDAR
ncbi:FAD-dependent oxidoreductase [Jiangella gansuensis]|uniref:FAD-dependent oxidoreductase n=1 Tax=Jiangella gansuensis TaxID=281473 RepID=UPI0004B1F0BC|nr:FAD-dependent oxidoreductase [Jiangella gansuensis]